MKLILGNQWQSTLEGDSVTITRSMTDPVPTATVRLADNNSSISPLPMQEMLILDDKVIPNPTTNMLLNPSLNPYTSNWTANTPTGATLSTVVGGGIRVAVSTTTAFAVNNIILSQTLPTGSITPGQNYVFSVYAQGSSSPQNIGAVLTLTWYTASNVGIIASTTLGTIPASTSLTRLSATITAPAGASFATVSLGVRYATGTNSGTITFTQVQWEPQWFPTLSYPTPFCGPSQTNCVQLPLGYWIRQYRKFAGFCVQLTYGDYHGNSRKVTISAVGYAWILGTIPTANSYTNKTDAYIIGDLLNTYLPGMVSTSNVITGVTLSNLGSNWDDVRTLHNNLTASSGFYWTIDDYWRAIYTPPGYFTMPFSLICDNSATPNYSTTYPAYNFTAQSDFTQPGSNILVIGSGSNVANVIDPAAIATYAQRSGYPFPITTFMRKVNESGLQSISDCTQRGIAEILQYDNPRSVYTLSTNVELTPGYGVAVTSNTDGLNATTLLVQSITEQWLGTNETLTDEWEYQASLGLINRNVSSMISRTFRATNSNTSAPAIAATSLVAFETIHIIDTASAGTVSTGYVPTILADTPIAYYRLNELTGTIADDSSGNAYQGIVNGGVTLGSTGLINHSSDTAMTFNGSSGYISLPTTLVPTGAHAWSIECWCQIVALPGAGTYAAIAAMGNNANQQQGALKVHNVAGTGTFVLSTWNGDIASGTISTGTTYYLAGTYDGTSTRLYLNGSLVAGPTNFTLNLTATYASIGADGTGGSLGEYFNGKAQGVAYYNYAFSATQVSAHYNAGI